MNAYGCVSTGHKEGLIEIVLQAETLANIQKSNARIKMKAPFDKESIYKHLLSRNADPIQ